MKKQLVTLSLCAALCLSMSACGNTVQPRDNAASPTTNQSQQIPNPWVDYKSAQSPFFRIDSIADAVGEIVGV